MSKYFIVYNIHKFKNINKEFIYPPAEFYQLVSLILNSPHSVTLENHVSDDLLHSEFRVIWWSEDSYNLWAVENAEKYKIIQHKFTMYRQLHNIEYRRLTSNDNYKSVFPYTDYPDKNNLINWMLIPYFKHYFTENILPLGNIKEYKGNNCLIHPETIDGNVARFIKERDSNIIRRPVSKSSTKQGNFPILLSYPFDQVIDTCIYKTPWLYRNLKKLNQQCEQLAEKFIEDCDHAAVLIGHESLGKGLTIHTHRLSDESRYTFTVVIRLSFDGNGVKSKFYEPLNNNDTQLHEYYKNPKLLNEYIRNKNYQEITFLSRTNILVFNAAYTPHDVEYDEDIYLFYVYDNVTFKENALEKIKAVSEINFSNQVYCLDYQKVALE